MSSLLPANEQYDRVVALALATAGEGLPMDEFAQRTAEFAAVPSADKVELYRKAVVGVRERQQEQE
jgi:hypothetical protein